MAVASTETDYAARRPGLVPTTAQRAAKAPKDAFTLPEMDRRAVERAPVKKQDRSAPADSAPASKVAPRPDKPPVTESASADRRSVGAGRSDDGTVSPPSADATETQPAATARPAPAPADNAAPGSAGPSATADAKQAETIARAAPASPADAAASTEPEGETGSDEENASDAAAAGAFPMPTSPAAPAAPPPVSAAPVQGQPQGQVQAQGQSAAQAQVSVQVSVQPTGQGPVSNPAPVANQGQAPGQAGPAQTGAVTAAATTTTVFAEALRAAGSDGNDKLGREIEATGEAAAANLLAVPAETPSGAAAVAAPLGLPALTPADAASPLTAAPPSAASAAAAAPVPLGAVPMTIGLRSLAGSNHFEIRLDPKDLGRIDVNLDIDKDLGTVKAHLVVDRPETLALLQRDAGSLQQALTQAGLDAGDGSINLSLRSDAQSSGQGADGRRSDTPSSGGRPGFSDPSEPRLSPDAGPLTALRGLGGIDIRI